MIKAKGCRSQGVELPGPSAGSLGDGQQPAARSPRGGSSSAAGLSAGEAAPPQNRVPKGHTEAQMGTESRAQGRGHSECCSPGATPQNAGQALRDPVRKDTQLGHSFLNGFTLFSVTLQNKRETQN